MSGADSLPDPSQFPHTVRPSGASAALQPWHIFPVRLRGPPEPPDPSAPGPSSSSSSPAPYSHSRTSLSRTVRNGPDVRSRSSRRDGNSRSSAARSAGSGRWPVRGQQTSLGPQGEGVSSMLPGVEFARRRRVHSVGRDTEAPGPSVGLVDGRPSRARPGSTVAHHHHHHHHHHHYHHYHHHYHPQTSEHPGRGAGRSSLHLDGGAGHDRRAGAASHSGAGSGNMASTSRAESQRITFRLPSWMQRSSSGGTSRQEALEARDRLDERLRAAAVGVPPRSSRSRMSLPGHPHAQSDYAHSLSEVEDEDSSNSDEEAWETSMREWLAAWSPAGAAGDDRFRHDIRSSGRPERPKGISKDSIAALPRELFCPKTKKRGRDGGGGGGVCEQEVCPVCLESFAAGHVLLSLPCNHRFHPDCLTPWLESHGQCPYCRARVPDSPKPPVPGANNSSSSGGDGVPDGEDLVSWMTAIERGITRLRFRVSNC